MADDLQATDRRCSTGDGLERFAHLGPAKGHHCLDRDEAVLQPFVLPRAVDRLERPDLPRESPQVRTICSTFFANGDRKHDVYYSNATQ